MRFTIFASLFFYLTLSAAWPWPANLFIRDSTGELQVRQNNNGNNNNNNNNDQQSSSASPASTAPPNTASATARATGSNTASGSRQPSPTPRPSGSSGSNGGNRTVVSTSIDPLSPPGGVSMLRPAATTTTWYKYGETITWVWNYTSLVLTPSAVDVLVSNTDTGYTFTVAANLSLDATQTVTWDTGRETNADITDQYTLAVYDAGNPAGATAVAQPGLLAVYNQYKFAMYTPQPYTALSDGYRCVTCNGAVTAMSRQAMGVMVTMAGVTVLSFTYFASGFMSL